MIYQAVHKPVLLKEVLHYIINDRNGIYVDCTVGEGGHSEAILSSLSAEGRLIGVDRDVEQLELARLRLKKYEDRCTLIKGDFRELPDILDVYNIKLVDGILMDLGVSLYQLSDPQRGFSFQQDGPLDMRFDRNSKPSAAELINSLSQEKLKEIISRFGQERWAGRIARAIVLRRRKRSIETTKELSQLICQVLPPYSKSRIHPATRTFQSLRIAVNQELEGLEEAIVNSAKRLKRDARIIVISFHSLEDKLVKNAFRFLAKGCLYPSESSQCSTEKKSVFKIITKRPIRPSFEEIEANPRCRSARMRVGESMGA